MTQSPATPLPPPKERRRLREAQELTQAQVAAKVGVTRETVRSWETGRTTPQGGKRAAYARLLADAPVKTRPPDRATAKNRKKSRSSRQPVTAAHTTAGAGTAAPSEPVRAAAHTAPPTVTEPVEPVELAADAGKDEDADPGPGTAVRQRSTRGGLTPDQAFDALYAFTSPALVRQTYLLTGRRALAKEAVERAFQLAWERWPEVAVDPDPVGWVRAASYEYALSPWHRLRRRHRQPEAPPAEPEDRKLLDTLLSLPTPYRRTLVLYDGVGLDLPDTAAETEATTPAAAHRLLHAREAVAQRLPELSDPGELQRRLDELAGAEKLGTSRSTVVREGGEHRSRFWTRAAIAFTALIIGASALALATSPRQYEPVPAPGAPISGVPPRMGPGKLTLQDKALYKKLHQAPESGPERLAPLPR